MNIRTKLILMLAIPIAALVLIAGVGFRDQSAQAERNEDITETAETIVELESLALRVADERLATLLVDFEPGAASQDAFANAIVATDAEIEAVQASRSDVSAPVAASVADTVVTARSSVGGDSMSGDSLQLYTEALEEISEVTNNQSLTGFNTDSLLSVQAIQRAREVSDSQESAWLQYFALEGEISPQELASITSAYGRVDFLQASAATTELSSGFTPLEAPATSSASRSLAQFQALAKEDLFEGTPGEVLPADVLPALVESRSEWSSAATNSQQFLLSDIGNSADQIDDQRSLFTLFAVLGSLLLFTLVFVIGRSILGPLGRLLDHADITTNERLPFAVAKLRTLGSSDEAPQLRSIPRETDDEIGLLVDAFNGMQDTAIKVATDQARSRRNVAEMFVSLGRRNQQLNHRMLNLITDLERDEQDSETLAGLYQLDHLATRMRRNAESLLVLAGNRSPRQWSRPVPMEDVVRSSLSEVELFERIVIGDLPEVAMQGNVVADVTHLLAELLDNATQFSEPSTSVNISAQETIEGVEIEVFDEGFGIGEQDLVELNERITNPPALDEAPSRLLGLFVVGRLSQQHGIHVELQSQPGVGTVATISIPNSLFAEELEDATAIKPPSALAGAAAPAALAPTPLGELPARKDLSAIEEINIDEVVEGGEIPAVVAEDATEIAPLEVDASASVGGAAPAEIPSWDPAAVHEEQLADAAMPTMDEVNEAMPSFPGVTIDEPVSHAPASVAASNDSWPLSKLDEASTRDAALEVEAPTVAEVPAPVVEVEAPVAEVSAPVVEVHPPVVDAPVAPIDTDIEPVQPALDELPPIEPFSIAPPLPEVVDAPVPAFDPTSDFDGTFDASPVVEPAPVTEVAAPVTAAPIVNTASSLPAPPILETAPAPAAELPRATQPPAVADLPAAAVQMQEPVVESGSFGGLPTRLPQATLSDVEAPAVMPLGDEMPAAGEAAPANPSAFAAFATGVNRGLNEVRDDSTPVSNEGEDA